MSELVLLQQEYPVRLPLGLPIRSIYLAVCFAIKYIISTSQTYHKNLTFVT
jgi:hypothetical protein